MKGNLRWWIAGVICSGMAVNYLERQVLSVLASEIRDEFRLSNGDCARIVFGRHLRPAGNGLRRSLLELLRFPQMWGLLAARVVADLPWQFYVFWLPEYLRRVCGMELAEVGMLARLSFLVGPVGSATGGWSGKARAPSWHARSQRHSAPLCYLRAFWLQWRPRAILILLTTFVQTARMTEHFATASVHSRHSRGEAGQLRRRNALLRSEVNLT